MTTSVPGFYAERSLSRRRQTHVLHRPLSGDDGASVVRPQQGTCQLDHGACTTHGKPSVACVGSYCQHCWSNNSYAWVKVCTYERSKGCGVCFW